MKRILSVLLVFLMLFSTFALVSCKEKEIELDEDDVEDLLWDVIQSAKNNEFDSIRISGRFSDDYEKETYAYDEGKDRSIVYYCCEGESFKSEFWIIKEDDTYTRITIDTDESGTEKTQDTVDEDEWESWVDQVIEDAVLGELVTEVCYEIDEWFVSATQKGDTVEASFENEQSYELWGTIETSTYDISMTFEEELITGFEATISYTYENIETGEKENAGDLELYLTYEYDITIELPEGLE